MALLSGTGDAVASGGDCVWLSRDLSMALLSETGDAVAGGGCLGEVLPCAVKVPVSLISDTTGKIDGAWSVFCVEAADTGVACVINHSES